MRHLIVKLSILAVSALMLICIFDQTYFLLTKQKREPVTYVFAPYPPRENPYQIVALGNSHTMMGIDFTNYQLPAINLSEHGAKLPYYLASLKQYHQQIAPSALIIIDISHIAFSLQPPHRLDNLQTAYYNKMSPFLIPKLNISFYLQKHLCPFLQSFAQIRQDYQQAIKTAHHPPPATNEIELNDDFNLVETIQAYLASNEAELVNHIKPEQIDFVSQPWSHESTKLSQQYFAQNLQTLKELLAYCQLHHWRPILITIPVYNKLENALPANYKSVYIYNQLAKIDLGKIPYFDFTQQTNFSRQALFFNDADHLNKNGAKVFSYLLLQKLIEQGYLSHSVDGYKY